MVADAEPYEIHLPLLSQDEDNDDTEILMDRIKELKQWDRLVTINTFVVVATILLSGWFGVSIPVPLYHTFRVFGCFGWILALVLFMVAVVYTAIEWWKIKDY